MNLTYIFQSCFVLQDDDTAFVFDYFKEPDNLKGFFKEKIVKKAKKLYVFTSHSHGDHYSEEIFEWDRIHSDITYIISDDVKTKKILRNKIIFLKKLDIYNDGTIFVKAFGSTDIGISFFIKYNDKQIFHAGDLNNWHWKNEVSALEAKEYEDFFLSELSLIKNDISYLDIAMFPVDPRMEIDIERGAKQFADAIDINYFLPMHFWGNFEALKNMAEYAKLVDVNFISWKNYGDSVEI